MSRLFLLFLACLFCPVPAFAGRDIVIGQVVDLSGPHAYIGRDFSAGAHTYFDEINSHGGINGQKIKYVVRDDRGDPAATVKMTEELLRSEKPSVLLGYFGDSGIRGVLASEAFRASGVILFAPVTGIDPDPGNDRLIVLRASFSDEIGKIVGHLSPIGTSKIAVVYMEDEYGSGALAVLQRSAQAAQIRVITQMLGTTETEADAAAARIAYSDAQAVLVLGDTIDSARFIKAYRGLDHGTPVYTLSIVNHTVLRELIGPEASRGVIITQVVPHPNDAQFKVGRELLALMSKYRDEPSSHLTMEGFIAAKALIGMLRERVPFGRAKEFDAGDFFVSLRPMPSRGSSYVDLTMVTKTGELLR
jgi:branched-chain amino acid transport system substrate-binding protein